MATATATLPVFLVPENGMLLEGGVEAHPNAGQPK